MAPGRGRIGKPVRIRRGPAARYGDPNRLDEEMLFDLIERQCADGIAFMAVHCGINLYIIERLEKQGYRYGADLVCYITPAEHLALPNEQDMVEGVKVARLAAHIGDLSKYPHRTRPRDLAMSKARRDLDWQGQFVQALFPEDAMRIRNDRSPTCDGSACTMCGDFCANKASSQMFQAALRGGVKA